MGTLVIILDDADSEVPWGIKEAYPNHYELSETTYLVSDDGITSTIAKKSE